VIVIAIGGQSNPGFSGERHALDRPLDRFYLEHEGRHVGYIVASPPDSGAGPEGCPCALS